MAKSTKLHFETIELLRGFAAISVLIYHVIEFNSWESFPEGYGLVWFKWGWAAVDIFYVISGFVITLSALNLRDQHDLSEKRIFFKFMSKRLRRIMPLHYLSLLIFIFIFSEIVIAPGFDLNFLSHLFFIHNFTPEFHRSINAPNWTLAIEMQFYLLLILLIRFINYHNLGRFILAAFILAFTWRAFSFYLSGYLYEGNTEYTFMLATQLPGMVDFFACGMLIAFFVRSHYFETLGKSLLFRFCLFVGFICLGGLAFIVFDSNKLVWWSLPQTVIFPRSMLAILFALLVGLLCVFRLPGRVLRLLAPLTYLGAISYGIYLFHFPLVLLSKDLPIPNIWKLILTLALTIAAAALSWHFFEKRFLDKARRDDKKGS